MNFNIMSVLFLKMIETGKIVSRSVNIAIVSLSLSSFLITSCGRIEVTVTKRNPQGQADSPSTAPTAPIDGTTLFFQLSNKPNAFSNSLFLNLGLNHTSYTQYKYKLGLSLTTQCDDLLSYSSDIPISQNIVESLGTLPDGLMRLCIIGRDASGVLQNTTYATTFEWTKDTIPPSSISLSGVPTGINNTTSFNLSIPTVDNEGHAIASYKTAIIYSSSQDCNSANFGSSETLISQNLTADLSTLSDGALTLCVLATDEAGNTQPAASALSYSWVKDSLAPTVVLNSSSSNATNVSPIMISIQFSESVSGLSLSDFNSTNATLSNLSGSGSSYTMELTPGADGVITLQLNSGAVLDVASNASVASSLISKTYDTQAPTAVLNNTPSSISGALALNINVSGDSDLNQFRQKVGTSSIDCTISSGYSSPQSTALALQSDLSSFADGALKICVIGGDQAGNWQAFANATSYSWTKDTSIPTATLTGYPTGFSKTTTLNIDVGGSNIQNYQFKLGDGSLDCASSSGYSSSQSAATNITSSVSGISDGTLKLCVIGQNSAGTWQAYSSATSVSWTKDTLLPTVAITSAAQTINLTNQTNYVVSGTCSENGRDVTLTSPFSATTLCSSGLWSMTLDLSGQSDGSVTISAQTDDVALNISTSAQQILTKNTSTPTATINNAPTGTNNITSLNVSIGGSGVTAYQYKVGASSSTNCLLSAGYSSDITSSSNIANSIAGLNDGAIKLCVIGKNSAGNYQPLASPSEVTWIKDTGAPSLAITSPASLVNLSNQSSYTVSGTCSEEGQSVVISGSVSASASCSSGAWSTNLNLSLLSDGNLLIKADLQDVAGNAASSASISPVKDTSTAIAVLSNTPVNPSNTSSLNISVGGAGVTAYQYKVGENATTNCALIAGYSGDINIATAISNNISGLSDGDIKICVIGKNAASNYQGLASATSYNWTKDTALPTVSVTSSLVTINVSNQTNYVLSGACSEDNRNVAITGDLSQSVLCVSNAWSKTLDLSSLSDGTITLNIDHSDAAGNAATTIPVALTKNTATPTATLSNTPSLLNNLTSLNVTVGGAGVTHYQYKVGLASVTNCSIESGYSTDQLVSTAITTNLTGLNDDLLKLCVVGKNAAGNYQPFSSATTVSWTKDTQIPTVSITSAAANITSSNLTNYAVSGTCSENGKTVAITGALTASPACSSGVWSTTLNFTSVSDGAVILYADLSDDAGNSATQAQQNLVKDTSSFAASLSGTPSSPSNTTVLNITVGGTDVVAYQYKLGANASISCTDSNGYSTDISVSTPISNNISAFGDISIELCVIGKNSLGTYQPYANATSFDWIKDTQNPGTFNITGVKGSEDSLLDAYLTSSGYPTVFWGSSTGASSYDLTIYDNDGTTLRCSTQNITNPTTQYSYSSCLSALTNNTNYKIKVVAKDLAGNSQTATNNMMAFKVNTQASTLTSTITGTGPIVADNTSTSTITITLKNSNSIPIENIVPTFIATGGGTNTYGACSTTNSSGTSTCTLKSTKAETKTLSIDTPISMSGGTVIFNPGTVNLTNSILSLSTSSVTAGSNITVTLTAKDAFENTLNSGGLTVVFSHSGGTSTGSFSATTDHGNGTYTSSFTGNLAGTATAITATINGSAFTGTTQSVTVNPGAPSQLSFNVQPSNAVAGVAISPSMKVRILDSYGNLTTSSGELVTLALSNNPGSSALSGTLSQTSSLGEAVFTGISLNKIGTGYTLLASAPSRTSSTSSGFNITAAAASKLAFSVQPTSGVVVTSISPALQVTVLDSYDNLVSTATNNITLAIGSNPGSSTLSGTLTKAAISGIATFSDISLNKAGSGYTLTAASSGLSGSTSASFNMSAGTPAKLAFSVEPSSAVAGVAISPSIKVQVLDANNNFVSNATNTISLAISNNPGSSTLSGALSQNAVNGEATFSNISLNKIGVGYTLQAASTGLTGATSSGFTITANTATQLSFSVQPASTTAGTTLSPALRVQTLDSYGNLNTTTGQLITMSISTNPGSSTLSGTTSQTTTLGEAVFNDLSLNKVGTGYILQATSTGLTSSNSSSFNISFNTANKLAFKVQPSNTTAGALIIPTVQVQVLDAYNNLVTTANNSITLAISNNPGSSTLSGTLTQSAVSGVATYLNISLNKTSLGYTLSAAATGLTGTTSTSFDIIPGAGTQLAFSVQPSNATGSATFSPAIKVRILDSNSNQLTSSGTNITLAIGTNPSGGTLSGTTTQSTVLGESTFSNLSINKIGTGYTLQATSSGLTSSTSNTFNITAGAAAKLAFSVQPASSTTDTVLSPAIQVQVQDSGGNLVSSATNNITLAIGTNPGSSTLSGTLTKAASSGVASFSDIALNNAGTGYTLNATASGLTSATSSSFNITVSGTNSAPSPDPMTFAVVPTVLSSTSVTMTATTASDADGVNYYFTESSTAPNGNDSPWIAETTWTAINLSPNTQYTYMVKARDLSADILTTANSTAVTVTTLAEMPATPIVRSATSTSVTVTIDPATNPVTTSSWSNSQATQFAVLCVSPCGNKYINPINNAQSTTESWNTYADWGTTSGKLLTGFSSTSLYQFKVKARNANQIETTFSGIGQSQVLATQTDTIVTGGTGSLKATAQLSKVGVLTTDDPTTLSILATDISNLANWSKSDSGATVIHTASKNEGNRAHLIYGVINATFASISNLTVNYRGLGNNNFCTRLWNHTSNSWTQIACPGNTLTLTSFTPAAPEQYAMKTSFGSGYYPIYLSAIGSYTGGGSPSTQQNVLQSDYAEFIITGNYETLPPSDASNFIASSTGASGGEIKLSWNNPTDQYFTGLRLVRKIGSVPTGTSDGSIFDLSSPTTSLTQTGLINGTTYYYKLFTKNQSDLWSNGIEPTPNGITPTDTAPPDVTNLSAFENAGQVQLNWTNPSVSDFAGVRILRKITNDITTESDPTATVIQNYLNANTTTYTDTTTVAQTNYYYKVFTRDGLYNWSSGKLIQIITVPLSQYKPRKLTESTIWSGSLSRTPFLMWSPPIAGLNVLDHYEVAIGSTSGATDIAGWTNTGKVNHITISNLNLTSNSTYYSSVRSHFSNGLISDPTVTNIWTIDTSPPTNTDSLTLNTSQINLTESPPISWSVTDSQSGFEGFKAQVYKSSDNSILSGWVDLSLDGIVHNLILQRNTDYYIKIVGIDKVTNEMTPINSYNWTTLNSGNNIPIGFGYNNSAQLGFESRLLKPHLSVPVLGGISFIQISAGGEHTCGLSNTGSAYCWGQNFYSQLGDNTNIDKSTPTLVSGGLIFSQISAGANYTCGLTTSGSAYCWGNNTSGQLGDGTTTPRSIPTLVSGGLLFSQISTVKITGFYQTCGITTSGAAYCWGSNSLGQLGDNTFQDRSTPTLVSGGYNFSHISVGYSHTCGITTSGSAYCWGANSQGQLGDNTTITKSTPTLVSGDLTFSQLNPGHNYSCGITTSGSIYCWGENAYGQLGDGTTTSKTTPTQVAGGFIFSQLSVSNNFTCGLTSMGSAYCWGYNFFGQLGNNTTNDTLSPTPITGGLIAYQVTTGFRHTCMLTTTGTTYCWGDNSAGKLGNLNSLLKNIPTSIASLNFTQISASYIHSCGITSSGAAYCWGDNTSGKLGDGTTISKTTPTLVSGDLTFSQISTGDYHTCGITTSGSAYCWGANPYGNLGDNSTVNKYVPTLVSGGLTFSQITSGYLHTCGITTSGSAYCWGYNTYGNLGDNSTTPKSTPSLVAGGLLFTKIDAGQYHTCGISTTGSSYCWGYNFYGQLGDNSTVDKSIPTLISGGLTFSQITAGTAHSCGLTTTGVAYCWGDNYYRQLGNNTSQSKTAPTLVSGGITFSQITTGQEHTCGISTIGTAYCWGGNNLGQLGDQTFNTRSIPNPVFGGYTFTHISAGNLHTLGIINPP